MSEEYKRMQVKVLYSFNNNSTVFLSRSKQMHSIKVAQIPLGGDEVVTLGAFDLKACVQQVLKSSPENFKLQSEDYAVYYKDITEQPDEPFVANGILSGLVSTSKQHLIPGRVCQNLSASFLFGDKGNASSHTLEIRLKLHTIEKSEQLTQPPVSQVGQTVAKRSSSFIDQQIPKKSRPSKAPISVNPSNPSNSSLAALAAAKATRTKSLPIFYPQNQQIFNIINADKSNAPSKYDNKSVQDRFKLAPFLQPKILENPQKKYNSKITPVQNSNLGEPQRAMRTRSMVTNKQMPLIISSPINEETDASDTDYQETHIHSENGEEEDDEETNSSPYTPQQPPYNPTSQYTQNQEQRLQQQHQQQHQQHQQQHHQQQQQLQHLHQQQLQQQQASSAATFQSLPDLEDLDSRKTHAIPHFRLPKNHDLVCMNSNCATINSITWRYFETGYHPNYLSLHRTKDFDMKHYEGMIGPLCNACYLFLRNKGFMRPEAVVKKYMQQQRYKELKQKDEQIMNNSNIGVNANGLPKQYASSPPVFHKFSTPSHTPSAINQVIQMQHSTSVNTGNNHSSNSNRPTPNYLNYDINDFMNQLNSFGGPLTDMDPLTDNHNLGVTPPMIATKSNTRVINLYDDGDDDKENCPPPATSDDNQQIHTGNELDDFESMIVKSFGQSSEKSSPNKNDHQTAVWMNSLFGEPTPRDQITPKDVNTTANSANTNNNHNDNTTSFYETPAELKDFGKKSTDETESEEDDVVKNHPNLPQLRTFTTHKSSSPLRSQKSMTVSNMPSSPLLTHPEEVDHKNTSSSPTSKASRVNTTTLVMSTSKGGELDHGSTPNTDFFSNDDGKENHINQVEVGNMNLEKIN